MRLTTMLATAALAFVALMVSGSVLAQAQAPQNRVVRGTTLVRDVYGKATQRKGDAGDWKKINGGDILSTQTTVKTEADSAVLLQLNGGHMFRVGENTTVLLRELGVGKSFSFQVLAGNIWSAVRAVTQPTKYEVETPSAVAGVSGTIFAVFHDTSSGQTEVSTNVGTVNVQQISAPNTPPGPSVPVSAGNYVQMARSDRFSSNGNNRPPPPKVMPQPPAYRAMWRTMHQEGWIRPLRAAAPVKLNRLIEPTLRKTIFLRRGRPNNGHRGQATPNGPGNRRPNKQNGGSREAAGGGRPEGKGSGSKPPGKPGPDRQNRDK